MRGPGPAQEPPLICISPTAADDPMDGASVTPVPSPRKRAEGNQILRQSRRQPPFSFSPRFSRSLQIAPLPPRTGGETQLQGRSSFRAAARPGPPAPEPPLRLPVTVSKTARACPASVACLTAWREGRRPGLATRTLNPHTPTSPSGPAATTRGQCRQRGAGFSPEGRGREC